MHGGSRPCRSARVLCAYHRYQRTCILLRTNVSDHPPRLSVVIPAYNEERRLPGTLEYLHAYLSRQPYSWEIIVVSNASTDATEDVVREASGSMSNLHLICINERGKGIAVKRGALQSQGDFVFLCDADMSMPPAHIEAFFEAEATADIAIGSREAPGSMRVGEPSHRHLMGRVFNRLVQRLAVGGLNDTQCGFKLFRREAAQHLFTMQTVHGFGFDVELLYLARKLGYSVREVPVEWHFDHDSRVRPGVDTVTMLVEVLMIRLRDLLGQYDYGQPVTANK